MQQSEVRHMPSEPSSATTDGGKTAVDTSAQSSESIKIEIPLDIVLSLLRQDELAKLQKYIASYLGKHWQP